MKKLISLLLLAAFVLCLAACGNEGPITEEKAYSIVYSHAGVNEADVIDPHFHVIAENGVPMNNIHFAVNGVDYDYNIHANTGEIISHKP